MSQSPGAAGPLTRRQLVGAAVRGAVMGLVAACAPGTAAQQGTEVQEPGRLRSRPASPTQTPTPGPTPLGIGGARDGLLYVPASYTAERSWPLVVMLHGAGGSAQGGIRPFRTLADEAGLILLAPESRDRTWDVVLGGFGPDVAFIDQALAHVFARCNVDAARIAVEGFSDGASYALSLGPVNGDLFARIVAFSPGFMKGSGRRHGKPRIFVSHGTADQILDIDSTSRRLVPELRGAGFDVTYREFAGPHTVPPEIARQAVAWLAGR